MHVKERHQAVGEPAIPSNSSIRELSAPQGAMSRRPPSLKRRLKTLSKRGMRGIFELGQRFGVDILPRHFYSEVPDIRELRADADWKVPRTMIGVRGADVEEQFDFLQSCCTPAICERLRIGDIYEAACSANGEPGFSPIDADFLHGFIRSVRPKKIVQVGCGVSTALILNAVAEMTEYSPEVVCVEPYPTNFLKRVSQAGQIRLVAERAQTVSLEELTGLGENGFLFIDSTHTVKPGSEVNRLIFEVLPRLESGTWVHFHDIYFPYDYQRGVLDEELFFSNESALLHAFLIDNAKFTIRTSLSMLHHADPSRLGRSLPNYRPSGNDHGLRASDGDFPASIYLQSF